MNREKLHHYDLVKNTDEDGTLKELAQHIGILDLVITVI